MVSPFVGLWGALGYLLAALFAALMLALYYHVAFNMDWRGFAVEFWTLLDVTFVFAVIGFPGFVLARFGIAYFAGRSALAFAIAIFIVSAAVGIAYGVPDVGMTNAKLYAPNVAPSSVEQIIQENQNWGVGRLWSYVWSYLTFLQLAFWAVVGGGMGLIYRAVEMMGWPDLHASDGKVGGI